MRTLAKPLLLSSMLLASGAFAAEANELSAGQSIRINAPPAAVWAVLGNFNGQPRWLPAAERSEIILGQNNQVGAIRRITRRDGTRVTERLLDYDPAKMRMAYTYVDGAVRASDYFPVVTVKDGGDGTSIVEWSAHLKRLAYWVDPPPAGQEDKTLVELYNNLYKLGLESLKRTVESGQ
jgi:mxaD protein